MHALSGAHTPLFKSAFFLVFLYFAMSLKNCHDCVRLFRSKIKRAHLKIVEAAIKMSRRSDVAINAQPHWQSIEATPYQGHLFQIIMVIIVGGGGS